VSCSKTAKAVPSASVVSGTCTGTRGSLSHGPDHRGGVSECPRDQT
jgi:hypothetical protein